MEQQSDEWYKVRLCKVTASNFSIALAGGDGKSRETLMSNLITEFDERKKVDSYRDKNMDNGIDKEPLARREYERVFNVKVEEVGFVELSEYIGGSPDGLVGDNGLIEIKCPTARVHRSYHTETKKPCKAYRDQMQGLMWITDREWCDFVSFRPESRFKRLWQKRYYRNEEAIKNIKIGIYVFVEDLKERINGLTGNNEF